MKRILSLLCAAMCVLLLAGCLSAPAAEPLSDARTDELHVLAQQLTAYMAAGDNAGAEAMMSDELIEAMDGGLIGIWNQLESAAGGFVGTNDYIGVTSGHYEALEMTVSFAAGTVIQRTVFDSDNRVCGLFFLDGAVEP